MHINIDKKFTNYLHYNKYFFCIVAIVLSFCTAPVTAQEPDTQEPREVEIGAGGNIRLEKPYRTKLEEEFEWHAHLLWESLYVTEGRDNLIGKGIYSASTEFNYKDLTIVPWIADAISTDYSEFNLNIIYGKTLFDNVELFVGYNHIQSRDSGDSFDDNEISLELAYFITKSFQILTNIYYSFDAQGSFAEMTLKRAYRINNKLSINLSTIIGFNYGYVVDGHTGINHGQLLANLSYQVNDEMEVYTYTGYNQVINRDSSRYNGDELLRDFFWGGVGLSYRF